MKDVDLDRLLRSAALAKHGPAPEMPFGFDTRVIALSRKNGNGAAFGQLLRRITLAAAAVIFLASAGAYLEFNRNGDEIASSTHPYPLPHSAIHNTLSP